MIVTLNGEYTKDFLKAFKEAYYSEYRIFDTFCRDNEIYSSEEVLHLMELVDEADYVKPR